METYTTLTFKSKKTALKNEKEIKMYFDVRFVGSSIDYGIDERGNEGFYVIYQLKAR